MKEKNSLPYKRAQRVGDEITKVISRTIIENVADPRVQRCTITSVEVSDDLRNAKIYFSILENNEGILKESRESLEKAKGYFRKIIGRELKLRYTPEIRFYFDDSLKRGRDISSIIDNVILEDKSKREKSGDVDVKYQKRDN